MGTNIVKTIQSRLDSMGMSQAQFAECVSATPQQSSIYRDLLIEVSESEFDYHLQKGDTCYSSPIFAKPFAKFYIENLKKKYETNEEAVRLINSIENFASICNE